MKLGSDFLLTEPDFFRPEPWIFDLVANKITTLLVHILSPAHITEPFKFPRSSAYEKNIPLGKSYAEIAFARKLNRWSLFGPRCALQQPNL